MHYWMKIPPEELSKLIKSGAEYTHEAFAGVACARQGLEPVTKARFRRLTIRGRNGSEKELPNCCRATKQNASSLNKERRLLSRGAIRRHKFTTPFWRLHGNRLRSGLIFFGTHRIPATFGASGPLSAILSAKGFLG